jgi:hypothetical protein
MRGVFSALCEMGEGDDVSAVLDFAAGQDWMRDLAARAGRLTVAGRTVPFTPGDEDLLQSLWLLYAASRVRDVLLLGHQPEPADDAVRDLDQALGRRQPSFPAIPAGQIAEFFAAIGCVPVTEPAFTPVLHEIIDCKPAAGPETPAEITGQAWPALMIGELVFTRAGVRVKAGTAHAVPGIADRSCLNWEYWRRHRETCDGSFWWGHNSQWRTEFRRDYITSRGNVYNFDAASDWHEKLRNGMARMHPAPELSPDQADEFIKHRCLLRNTPEEDVSLPDHVVDERR